VTLIRLTLGVYKTPSLKYSDWGSPINLEVLLPNRQEAGEAARKMKTGDFKTDVMNKLETGIDIVEIAELKVLIERFGDRVLNRLFTANEISYCKNKPYQYQNFAGRMAAKEATFKALGKGWNLGIQWKNVEVINDEHGRPSLKISGKAKEIFILNGFVHHKLSISHSKTYAISTVIIHD